MNDQEVEKGRTYLTPGQKPPEGASVQQGPKGGSYYEDTGSQDKKPEGQSKPEAKPSESKPEAKPSSELSPEQEAHLDAVWEKTFAQHINEGMSESQASKKASKDVYVTDKKQILSEMDTNKSLNKSWPEPFIKACSENKIELSKIWPKTFVKACKKRKI